ncbi:hypothetical protein C9J27_20435 [Photobacterium kishitanii]|uniref:Uncharacterized protein n=1 Tax=Photobacterium kishitanii TaxID=318456 RepID=A0A2T3KCZ3_9GAMM|nr:hypothetical protein C9J27_20435 [Photobacterium kishitanii]
MCQFNLVALIVTRMRQNICKAFFAWLNHRNKGGTTVEEVCKTKLFLALCENIFIFNFQDHKPKKHQKIIIFLIHNQVITP